MELILKEYVIAQWLEQVGCERCETDFGKTERSGSAAGNLLLLVAS